MRLIRPFVLAFLPVLVAPLHGAAQQRLSDRVRAFVREQSPVVALTDVRVIDGTGAPASTGMTVVIREGRIAELGPSAAVPIPDGATVLDLAGHTVTPGLVMVHEHMFYPSGQGAYNQQQNSFPVLYLAGGATTIRTGGSRDPFGDLNLKRAIDDGTIPGPTMFVTGPYVNGPGLPLLFVNALDGAADARRFVNYWADEGATSFKAYMQISRAELGAAIDAAHARGLQFTGHLCSVTYREAADLGIDNLEHGLYAATDFVPDKEPDVCPSGRARSRAMENFDPEGHQSTELIRHLVNRGVALTSTLTVFEASVPGRPRAPDGALDALAPDARDRYLRTWSRLQAPDAAAVRRLENGMAFEKAFADAGGLLVAGTDPTGYGGVVAGYANQRAVELLVEAGFSPEGAVRVATANGAALLGIDDHVGTVAPGMVADLLVVRGNPVARIADIRQPVLVFKDGVGYDARALFDSVRGTVGIR